VPPESKILEDGIGYLKIVEFDKDTEDEVRSALESLARSGARKLALDLRGSAHGEPAGAVPVASLFVKEVGKLVSRRGGEQTLGSGGKEPAWTQPLAVLVGNSTSGPGEVLAAALADGGQATLVGEKTFGRAAVQKIVPVAEGALVLTVAKYVSPKGTEIHGQGKGLEPKVIVETREDLDDETAAGDLPDDVLLKAIEILKTPAEKEKKAA
jgi:carboxyl-terminal processing protease